MTIGIENHDKPAPASDVLARLIASLTRSGANRENVLSIDHDALRSLIEEGRAALTTSAPSQGEEGEG